MWKAKRKWARFVACAVFLNYVLSAGAVRAAAPPPPIDLTGEICLSGTKVIQVNGVNYTYCTMLGVLPPNTAIQIDDLDGLAPEAGDVASVANANLFFGTPDPNNFVDGHRNLPAVSGGTYIDWNNLFNNGIGPLTGSGAVALGSVENHRILDYTANDDHNMLDQASCVQGGSALPKEDFTQTYVANNNQFLYIGQERRTNNGNSVYYFVFSHEPPITVFNNACRQTNKPTDRGQLQFKLTEGDIEILVNFPSSSDPAGGAVFFRKFVEPQNYVPTYIPVKDAIFHPGWGATAGTSVQNFSVNTTLQSFAQWGGIDNQGDAVATGSYTVAEFAEWAIPLFDFFGNAACGESLFLTGVSRSATGQAGSITESSALKDLIGPKLYSFGGVDANASLEPSCSLDISFSGSASSPAGALTTSNATFAWQFFKCVDGCDTDVQVGDQDTGAGSVANDDAGTHTVSGAGTYRAVLTVTETASGCTDSVATNTVNLSRFAVVATAPDSCSNVLAYSGQQITGGSTVDGKTGDGSLGTVSCTWDVTKTNGLSGCTGASTLAGGSCTATSGLYNPTVSCNDTRSAAQTGGTSQLVCPASDGDPATIFGPPTIRIAPDNTSLACPAIDSAGTDVTYTATVTGGSGSGTVSWTVGGANTAAACGNSTTCLVDFATNDFCGTITVQASLDDGNPLCQDATSEQETVTKTTSVTATNLNP